MLWFQVYHMGNVGIHKYSNPADSTAEDLFAFYEINQEQAFPFDSIIRSNISPIVGHLGMYSRQAPVKIDHLRIPSAST